ncbi:MAG: DNA polymerase III subunit delta [Vicinamibacterales bacterium]
MAVSTVAAVRKQIAQRRPDPIYLIVGDDDAEMSRLASDLSALVDEDLRAFNVERLYASDKVVTPSAIAEAARLLPMIASHRVVVVLRAEKILKPKRKGKSDDVPSGDEEEPGAVESDALEAYVKKPEPTTVLAFVASDVDRTRRLYKQLVKTATIVECWGLKSRDGRHDPRQTARQAEVLVRQAATEAGRNIDPAAARLVAERAGTDIARLRGDVEKLMLYSAGSAKISLADAKEVVSAESSQDDWAVTNAIARGDTREALRELGLSLDSGGVTFMILGQLGYFVREKLVTIDPKRVRGAVEAVFRTDMDLKSSGGDSRVLLERLVVELCGKAGRRT